MSAVAVPAPTRRLGSRVWAALTGAWGVAAGLAPHVLHHVGPLAGATIVAGFGGKALFFALGLVLLVPLLRRLYRHFGTWLAPAIAVLLFAAMFALSSLVIAPRITGGAQDPAPALQQPTGHDAHHEK